MSVHEEDTQQPGMDDGANQKYIRISQHKRYREGTAPFDNETVQQIDSVVKEDNDAPKDVPRSIEGYILVLDGIHQEAVEDDILSIFEEYGEVKQLHINLDRKTGLTKGYALLEYEKASSAANAILDRNNTKLLDQTITVDWAFRK